VIVIGHCSIGNTPCEVCKGKACIKKTPLLSSLNRLEIEKISEGVVFKDYKAGETVFSIGEKADKLYIVCSGRMKIYKYLSDGHEQILYIYSPGDFIGAFNLLKEDEFEFSAEALEDMTISCLSKDTFDQIILKNPTITLKILEKSYERIKAAERLVERLSVSSADAKVAGLLLNLINDFGTKNEKGIMLNLSINREEMGSYAGISRETMTRKLKLFKELGYIDFIGNKKILILNEQALRDLL